MRMDLLCIGPGPANFELIAVRQVAWRSPDFPSSDVYNIIYNVFDVVTGRDEYNKIEENIIVKQNKDTTNSINNNEWNS